MADLLKLDKKFKHCFADCFPNDIPHTKDLPQDMYHNIELEPGTPVSVAQSYSCPQKYRPGWKTLIKQHLAAGRIRPSSSPYASPSFIIPKSDPNVLPRWVNNYQNLNCLTVANNYPLPRRDNILVDCSKGCIWGKIDMTNSFFQTFVNPDHTSPTPCNLGPARPDWGMLLDLVPPPPQNFPWSEHQGNREGGQL